MLSTRSSRSALSWRIDGPGPRPGGWSPLVRARAGGSPSPAASAAAPVRTLGRLGLKVGCENGLRLLEDCDAARLQIGDGEEDRKIGTAPWMQDDVGCGYRTVRYKQRSLAAHQQAPGSPRFGVSAVGRGDCAHEPFAWRNASQAVVRCRALICARDGCRNWPALDDRSRV